MERRLEHIVRLRAGGVCEYCLLPESISNLPFPIDHVIARQHRGGTVAENLAEACPSCNLHKGPNIAGIDPETGQITVLFNPRRDAWSVHFRYEAATLVGLTPAGRATVQTLSMNDERLVALRRFLIEAGLFPRPPAPPEQQQQQSKEGPTP